MILVPPLAFAILDAFDDPTLIAERGIVRAANDGIALARGRYVARMDSDDLATPERFAKQIAYLDQHPDCVLVGSRVQIMDPYCSPVSVSGQPLTHEEINAELLTVRGGWALVV